MIKNFLFSLIKILTINLNILFKKKTLLKKLKILESLRKTFVMSVLNSFKKSIWRMAIMAAEKLPSQIF